MVANDAGSEAAGLVRKGPQELCILDQISKNWILANEVALDCIGDQSGTVQDCLELLPCPSLDSQLPIGLDRPPEI